MADNTAVAAGKPASAWPDGPVRRRRVIVVHGASPRPFDTFMRPRVEREFERYAKRRGLNFSIGGIRPVDAAGHVVCQKLTLDDGAARVETDYVVGLWDDIVKTDMGVSLPRYVVQASRYFWEFVTTGSFLRFYRGYYRFGLVWLLPHIVIWLSALLAVAAAAAAYFALDEVAGGIVAGIIALMIVAVLPFFLIRWIDAVTYSSWVGKAAIMLTRHSTGTHQAMNARARSFAATLHELLDRDDVDETIIIGHCGGANILMATYAEVLRKRGDRPFARPVWLLTASSALTLATLPASQSARDDVAAIAATPHSQWIDVQSRHDSLNAYRSQIQDVLGMPRPDPRQPRIFIAQLKKMLLPEQYARIRRDLMRIHLQTLHANDTDHWYDYCLIVCGRERFAQRLALGEEYIPS